MKTGLRATLAGAALAFALSACTRVVDTQNFLRPTTSPGVDAGAFTGKLPPGYTVSSDFTPTADGERLYRVRLENPDAKTTVVYWGGNHFCIHDSAADVAQFLAREWRPNVVFIDYRGYGQSSGKPSLEALARDAQLVLADERRRATAEGKKLVVSGHSLGGAVAGTAALAVHVDGAIMIAAMTTMQDIVSASIPWFYKPFVTVSLTSDLAQLNNPKALSNYRGPLLIVAGEKDATTPPDMARAIYGASATAPDRKRLVIVPGADHESLRDASETRAAVLEFAMANRF